MITRKNRNLFFFTALILVGCKGEFETHNADLYNSDSDFSNEYSQSKRVNGVDVNLAYKPTDLMVQQTIDNLSTNEVVNKDSIKEKYTKYLYFVLSYSRENKELLSTVSSSRSEFNNLQNILTFNMSEMVLLTNEKSDTIPIVDYNFSRTYGVSRSTGLLFVFERNKIVDTSKEINFKLKDIGIGIGDLNFKYKADLIKNN